MFPVTSPVFASVTVLPFIVIVGAIPGVLSALSVALFPYVSVIVIVASTLLFADAKSLPATSTDHVFPSEFTVVGYVFPFTVTITVSPAFASPPTVPVTGIC